MIPRAALRTAKSHAGFVIVVALALAYSAAVEVYVKSSAFNTVAHVVSSGAGFGVGYPLARRLIALQGGSAAALMTAAEMIEEARDFLTAWERRLRL